MCNWVKQLVDVILTSTLTIQIKNDNLIDKYSIQDQKKHYDIFFIRIEKNILYLLFFIAWILIDPQSTHGLSSWTPG